MDESGVVVLILVLGGAAFTIATFVEVLRTPEGAKYQSGNKAIWGVATGSPPTRTSPHEPAVPGAGEVARESWP